MPVTSPQHRASLQRVLVGVGIAATLATAGCSGSGAPASSSGDAGKLSVVASFYPLEFATQQIGGEHVAVSSLTKPGAEPHDLELGAQDVSGLSQADLLVYSAGFQPAVDKAMDIVAPKATFNAATVAELEPVHLGGGHTADDGHDHGALDPHFWLDPERYALVAQGIEDKLIAIDPANAAAYKSNGAAFMAKLQALDSDFKAGLKTCKIKTLVTSHAAFGYLAERYGFEQVGITGLDPEAEPSASALAEVTKLVKTDGMTTVYSEVLAEPRFAQTVATSAGVQLAVLDPVEGITAQSPGKNYFEVMAANLAALKKGQDCT